MTTYKIVIKDELSIYETVYVQTALSEDQLLHRVKATMDLFDHDCSLEVSELETFDGFLDLNNFVEKAMKEHDFERNEEGEVK